MQVNREMNILVVDDFSTMRKIVKNLLKELGFHHFDEADDGATAWPMVQTGKYDLIVSDWNMPEMTGIDLLRRVRADGNLKDTPFLLITAEAKRSQILEATQSGVDGYIVKPFTAATLNGKIHKIFERVTKRKNSE
ncbi:MAG: chemotaxis response regulator CheY [Thiomicrorhabdus sp.]|jgi:two-component system chemotaxis response regulator CheY|nr:chemotaxis response regulator CheY [Thiomicrorhabdus sp.]